MNGQLTFAMPRVVVIDLFVPPAFETLGFVDVNAIGRACEGYPVSCRFVAVEAGKHGMS